MAILSLLQWRMATGACAPADRLFGESASRALNRFPEFAVVIVNLPQQRWQQYREQFIRTWEASPIRPIAGQLIRWP
jgi:hypothetical protein